MRFTGVRVVLCDADGNLFPSEEPAFEASAEVTNRYLAALGSDRRFTAEELRLATTGRNFRTTAADLATAVRHAHEGKLYFLPHIASRLASMAVRGEVTPQSQLDERGLEIFKFMAEGMTNAEIAGRLVVSVRTVDHHVSAVLQKLGVATRREAAAAVATSTTP